jgi:hypothetical protein
MGGGGRHENLALGETPNIAARLEGLAQPNTAMISPVTAQLVQRVFVLEDLGPHELKGVTEPMRLYTVVSPREVGNDGSGALPTGGFEALVGRDEEIGLLLRRWGGSLPMTCSRRLPGKTRRPCNQPWRSWWQRNYSTNEVGRPGLGTCSNTL